MKKILFTLLLILFFIPRVDADSVYSELSYCGNSQFPLQNTYIPANGGYTCNLEVNFSESDVTESYTFPYLNLIIKSRYLHSISLTYSQGSNAGVFNQSIINYSPIQTDSNGNTSYVVQLVQGGNGNWSFNDGYYTPSPKPSVIFHNWSNSNSFFTIVAAYMTTEQLDVNSAQQRQEMIDAINKIDLTETNENLEEVKESIDGVRQDILDLNESITSTEGPTNLGALDNSAGWLPAGPVDSILNLPLSLLNSLLTAVSSTCQPLNITFPFVDFNYQLPCISSIYAKISGLNAIVDLIGYTVGVLILYYYFKHLYKWIDNKITMQNDNDWGGI